MEPRVWGRLCTKDTPGRGRAGDQVLEPPVVWFGVESKGLKAGYGGDMAGEVKLAKLAKLGQMGQVSCVLCQIHLLVSARNMPSLYSEIFLGSH